MVEEGDDNLDLSKSNKNLADDEALESEPKNVRLIFKDRCKVVLKVPLAPNGENFVLVRVNLEGKPIMRDRLTHDQEP